MADHWASYTLEHEHGLVWARFELGSWHGRCSQGSNRSENS